jgi:hypothetical protein
VGAAGREAAAVVKVVKKKVEIGGGVADSGCARGAM